MTPRFVARQLACPKGLPGRVMGFLMNRHNARMNEFALRQISVRPPGKILEVGFGGGPVLSRLIDRSQLLVGLDRSPQMVRQARSRFRHEIDAGRADFRVGRVEALPFENAAFSNVLSVNTVYFWTSLAAGFREMRRVLAPGGQVVICFLPKEHMTRKNMPGDIFTLRTIDDVRTGFLTAGFSEPSVARPESGSEWAVVLARN